MIRRHCNEDAGIKQEGGASNNRRLQEEQPFVIDVKDCLDQRDYERGANHRNEY